MPCAQSLCLVERIPVDRLAQSEVYQHLGHIVAALPAQAYAGRDPAVYLKQLRNAGVLVHHERKRGYSLPLHRLQKVCRPSQHLRVVYRPDHAGAPRVKRVPPEDLIRVAHADRSVTVHKEDGPEPLIIIDALLKDVIIYVYAVLRYVRLKVFSLFEFMESDGAESVARLDDQRKIGLRDKLFYRLIRHPCLWHRYARPERVLKSPLLVKGIYVYISRSARERGIRPQHVLV